MMAYTIIRERNQRIMATKKSDEVCEDKYVFLKAYVDGQLYQTQQPPKSYILL